ncbi:hypothetical protein MHU86_21932 [Fragilaria crotonensis]|nr:hypothetical protein MHU86_21932 [Fragilaria crotonensis]
MSTPRIPISRLLLVPKARPGRKCRDTPLDPYPTKYYGDAIIQKNSSSTRIFFHNVKGLTYSTAGEDYRYYLSCLQAYDIDIAGLSETNTCWSHQHLAAEFRATVRRYYPQNKVTFGCVSPLIDKCLERESYQSGGNLTLITGALVAQATASKVSDDPKGLGRWNSVTLEGKSDSRISIITAYRSCPGSIKTSPIGSVFSREYTYLKDQGHSSLNPRTVFLADLHEFIRPMQEQGNAIILMMDANATIESDQRLASFIQSCSLHDLHANDPATSTYIGAAARRIDYIFGCQKIREVMSRSGTLSYSEGPQSDHRGLYVDLELGSYLQSTKMKISQPTHRSLQTGNPELVSSYHSSMLQYYSQHNMEKRIDDLFDNHQSLSREEVRRILTSWDNDQGRAMLHSERLLRRPPKKYQWSPTLRNAAIVCRYWKLRLRESLKGEDYQYFNFYLKLQWGHRLVRQACDLDLLHSGQHGSVPRRTSLDPIMLTQLTTDLCRILKHDFARFDNDASSCYDRIIVALGMLAARRCGMPTNAIRLHADALQFMKYTVKTIHGISEENYHGTAYAPLFGTGQGSGASPSVWLTLVVIMLNTLDRIVPDRINFVPVQGKRNHSRLVDAFVDDTSLGFTSAGNMDYDQLIQRLQDIAQTWGAYSISLGRKTESFKMFVVCPLLGVEKWQTNSSTNHPARQKDTSQTR